MKITHEIKINAPLEDVWKRTVDFNNWASWNPNVSTSTTQAGLDIKVGDTFTLSQPGMGSIEWTITHVDLHKSCSWSATHNGIEMIAHHELEGNQDGINNKISIEVNASGITKLLVIALYPLYKLALIKENKGFKKSFH